MASAIPRNDARFNHAELVEATGSECPAFEGFVEGVCTDSRALQPGSLFVALRGEHFDGHRFASAAAQAGARVLVVEEPISDPGSAVVLVVPSTLVALGELARFHRLRWPGKLVAVAGSVGKTTTRSSVAAVIRAAGQEVHCPSGNLNNRIGVPTVLLGLTPAHAVCVVELGTSLPGEIEQLSRIAQPDVAVLTRIALEHSEGLGGLDAIEREEGALLRALGADAAAVVNGDDERCTRQLLGSPAERQIAYGIGAGESHPTYYRIGVEAGVSGAGDRVRIQRPAGLPLEAQSPLLGLPGAYALAAAVAAAEALLGRSLGAAELAQAAADPALGEPGRLSPVPLADGSLVLDDTYNSSPASVKSSVAVARELAERRRARLLLVLGEMRELGALSREAHRDVGADIAAARPALVLAFGGDAAAFLEVPSVQGIATRFAEDAPAALLALRPQLRPGDVILVKASRSLRGERIVSGLRQSLGDSA